jgi:hypothetical protein
MVCRALDEESAVSGEPHSDQGNGWNYGHVLFALVIAFVLQSMFLPCMCQIGTGKMNFALVFDGLMALRIAAARIIKQRDNGWIFYTALIYLSPLWIDLSSRVVLGPH